MCADLPPRLSETNTTAPRERSIISFGMPRARITGAGGLIVLWVIACVGGLGMLWRYKARPGDPGDPPARWPSPPALTLARDAPTLVLAAHPRCPCTRATLHELDRVLHDAPDVHAYVLFVVPDGVEPGWERGELWDRAEELPHTTVIADHGGALAAGAFRLAVSGHVLVYDPDGSLRFSGGITPSRGHEGDSVGRERVAAVLAGEAPDAAVSHVFGCSLEEVP